MKTILLLSLVVAVAVAQIFTTPGWTLPSITTPGWTTPNIDHDKLMICTHDSNAFTVSSVTFGTNGETMSYVFQLTTAGRFKIAYAETKQATVSAMAGYGGVVEIGEINAANFTWPHSMTTGWTLDTTNSQCEGLGAKTAKLIIKHSSPSAEIACLLDNSNRNNMKCNFTIDGLTFNDPTNNKAYMVMTFYVNVAEVNGDFQEACAEINENSVCASGNGTVKVGFSWIPKIEIGADKHLANLTIPEGWKRAEGEFGEDFKAMKALVVFGENGAGSSDKKITWDPELDVKGTAQEQTTTTSSTSQSSSAATTQANAASRLSFF